MYRVYRKPPARQRRGRLLELALSTLVMGACTSEPGPSKAGFSVRDSAGVAIVTNLTPAWEDGAAWTLEPDWSTPGPSETGTARPLHTVVGVQRLPDGRVVVANAGSSQLLWYSASGAFLSATGGAGEGPGEFDGMYSLDRCEDDTLVVQEYHRVSFWSPSGDHIETRPILPGPSDRGSIRMEGVSSDCEALLLRAQLSAVTRLGEVSRPELSLFWEGRIDAERDTVLTGLAWAEFFGGPFEGNLVEKVRPWGAMSVWTASDHGVVVGPADDFELWRFDAEGRMEAIIRWEQDREPITAIDRGEYERARGRFLANRPSSHGDVYVALDEAPLPSFKPPYAGVLGDPHGNLWVREYPSGLAAGRLDLEWGDRSEPEAWLVIDRDGRLLGTVTIDGAVDVLAVFEEHLGVIRRDEWDVERVELLRIER